MASWLNLELTAALLSLAYLVLAMRENSFCWYCAFFGTVIYIWIFGGVKLYMDSLLNVYYLIMAVYGWYQWRRGGSDHHGLKISRWRAGHHVLALVGVLLLSVISGFLLQENTDAQWPYLDSFTTWGSVLTTYMVARKILENWLYWIVVDSVSIYLYLDRALYFTAALFAIYVVLVVIGYFTWRKHYFGQYRQETAAGTV